MSHASVASSALALPDLAPLRRTLRTIARVVPAAAQAIGLAAILYALVAAPGLLSDRASTVPVYAESAQ